MSQQDQKGKGKEEKVEEHELEHMSDLAYVPKDSGWGWWCVVGGFFVEFLVVGAAAKSFGILFIEFHEKFNASNAATSWIVALSQCLALLLGPVATTLAGHFSARVVVFCGGVFCCAGFIISIYAVNLKFLYFSYGILVGIGSALAFAPTIVTIGQYFEKRRSLANGITVAGSGVGNFAVPPLMRLLLDYYGLSGALLVLAGLMLNVCVCAMLLRPITYYKRAAHAHRARSKPAPHHVIDAAPASLCEDRTKTSSTTDQNTTNNEDDATTYEVNGSSTLERDRSCQPLVLSDAPPEAEAGEMVAAKDVVFGSLQSLPRHSEGAPQQSASPSSSSSRGCGCCESRPGASSSLPKFDLKLLKNPVFLPYALSVFFAFCGYPQLFFIIPAQAKELRISPTDSAFLVSIVGITDLVGRIGFGAIADYNVIRKRTIFCGSMAVAGFACFFIPLLRNFVGMSVFCAVIGLFAGAYIALIAVILAERLGVHQLQNTFGLVVMFMGMPFLFAPATAGWLKDVTGRWDASFYFCGATMFAGALCPLFESAAIKCLHKKQQPE